MWNQYLTGCFEGLLQNCHKHLWNFAYGGAIIDPSAVINIDSCSVSLVEHVNRWIEKLDASSTGKRTKALLPSSSGETQFLGGNIICKQVY